MISPSLQFSALHSMRGVAAACVLIGHVTSMYYRDAEFFSHKYLAVFLFFMLSGFVMSDSYEQRLNRGMSLANYMLKRAIRLFPLLAAGAVSGALAYLPTSRGVRLDDLSAVVFGAFAIPFPGRTSVGWGSFPLNPPEWSLFFELCAYVLHGLILAALSTRMLIVVLTVLTPVLAVITVAYAPAWPFWCGYVQVLYGFVAGMLIWRMRTRLAVPPIPAWALGTIIVLCCSIPVSFGAGIDLAAQIVLFPALILFGAGLGRGPGSPLGQLAGDLSYPLYILHWPVLVVVKAYLVWRVGPAVSAVIAVVLSVIVAYGALRLFDEPVRRKLAYALRAPSLAAG